MTGETYWETAYFELHTTYCNQREGLAIYQSPVMNGRFDYYVFDHVIY